MHRWPKAGPNEVARMLALVVPLVAASPIAARNVDLAWTHSDPARVTSFRIEYGTASSGSYASSLSVNASSVRGADGVYRYTLTSIPDQANLYARLRASDAESIQSNYSGEKVFAGLPAPPPPVDPGTPSLNQSFDSAPLGNAVSGWVDTAANNSMTVDDSLFVLVELSSNRFLSTIDTGTNIHSHYAPSGVSGWASYELTGRLRRSGSSGGVGVTAYSAYPTTDRYYRLGAPAGGGFVIDSHPGSVLTCVQANTGVVPADSVWQHFRLRVVPTSSGNRIDAKVWQEGGSEPANWQASCTDARSTRPTGGTVGLWSSGGDSKAWDDIAVAPSDGTGGGSLPGSPPPPAPEPLGQPGQPVLVP